MSSHNHENNLPEKENEDLKEAIEESHFETRNLQARINDQRDLRDQVKQLKQQLLERPLGKRKAKMHLRDEFDEGMFIYGECNTCGYHGPVPEDVAFCPHCGVGVTDEEAYLVANDEIIAQLREDVSIAQVAAIDLAKNAASEKMNLLDELEQAKADASRWQTNHNIAYGNWAERERQIQDLRAQVEQLTKERNEWEAKWKRLANSID